MDMDSQQFFQDHYIYSNQMSTLLLDDLQKFPSGHATLCMKPGMLMRFELLLSWQLIPFLIY